MKLKKIVACVLALTITSISTFSVSADKVAEQPNKITIPSMKFIESAKRNILEVDECSDGLISVQSIKKVDTLVESVKHECPSISDYQLGKLVLIMLGDDEEFVNSLPEDKVLESLQYTAVERTEVYFRETEDGKLVQISKSDYEANNADITTQATIPNYSETHGDIIIRSTAYKRTPTYALNGRDYYSIRGEVIWNGRPGSTGKDLLVISSNGNIDNSYDHCAYALWYRGTNTNETHSETAHLLGNNGNFLKTSSPNMYGMGAEVQLEFYNYPPYMLHSVYAYYGVSAQTDITCQVSYAHTILAWTPSFSISSGGSVSFGGIGIQRQTFYGTPFTLYHS